MFFESRLMKIAILTSGALAFVACGNRPEASSDVKIVGGQEIPNGQTDTRALATVALTTELNRGADNSPLDSGHSFCSGTVISERVVITAAHCLQQFDQDSRQKLADLILPDKRDFLVHFDNAVGRGGTWIRAEEVIPHPDWSPEQTLSPQPSSPPNDVGVIVLAEPIPAGARPAKVAPMGLSLEGKAVHLVGFGVTQSRGNNDTGRKRQVKVAINTEDSGSQRITVGQFFRGACAGDSGGPAYVENGSDYDVIGATSTGAELFGMCIGLLNNYTDIRYSMDWVDSVVGEFL